MPDVPCLQFIRFPVIWRRVSHGFGVSQREDRPGDSRGAVVPPHAEQVTPMLNSTEVARQAYRRLDQAFLRLQAVREALDATGAAGARPADALYLEWEDACRHFR